MIGKKNLNQNSMTGAAAAMHTSGSVNKRRGLAGALPFAMHTSTLAPLHYIQLTTHLHTHLQLLSLLLLRRQLGGQRHQLLLATLAAQLSSLQLARLRQVANTQANAAGRHNWRVDKLQVTRKLDGFTLPSSS